MEENVDVKALRAKFHAQLEMAASGGGTGVRPHAVGALPESLTNGALRNKTSAVPPRPVLPVSAHNEAEMFPSGPQGVFPRPPPSHRLGAQESPPSNRIKLTGELLQRKILQQHGDMKAPSTLKPPLPSQRSVSEVAPLRKPLPNVGPRPSKPRRPPHVNLEHLRRKAPAVLPKRNTEPQSSKGPARPPNKPGNLTSSFSELEDYDDISALPPPPPTPPKPRDSWTDGFPSQHEDSDQEIYEDPDRPVPAERKPKETKKTELDKRELKEKQKLENEYRKRFKLNGPIEVIHMARVREDWQGGKNDLSVRQGDSVEIIRVNNNPGGKWLARDMRGSVGYISNSCVDVDYEEVKRKILGQAAPTFHPSAGRPVNPEVYDDIGSNDQLDSFHSDDVYDDVDQDFPPPPPEIRSKQQEKDEKDLRKRFKFEGPIRVLYTMMVDPNASLKKAGSKDLPVVRGEILDVIQETSKKQLLCRNKQGKYGYVPLNYLLHEENEVYDDIDTASDIYDNDDS
ncbi:FYN-binding protein 1 isoform X2 [Labeo rohita]|uniref:FYN-binding protein 1 isoform X2 n=1 Tax=Labeo rohita TaxID=84645 RepID=UPI0021E23224|nr:FYN-binding protein 1 isoform X2 [Labeo rohita]